MKIFVQVVEGNIYELEVNEHTSIEEARDLLISNYKDEKDFKNKLPSQSNSSIVITYNFVYNGKYLFDPDPFAVLKENTRVILYVKKTRARGLVRLEIVDDSENEVEEEDMESPAFQEFTRFVVRGANASLFSQVFNPQNNFWNHSAELAEVEDILHSDDSQGAHYISSTFMLERFHQLFRYNDTNIGTILNVMGGGPLLTFGNSDNESSHTNNNDNENDNDNENRNNASTYADFERQIYSNRVYNDYDDNPNIIDELNIMIMEMPTNSKNAYDDLLKRIDSTPELNKIAKQIGPLKVAQIFKENNYDIDKSIDSIKNVDQKSQDNNEKSTNNDNDN